MIGLATIRAAMMNKSYADRQTQRHRETDRQIDRQRGPRETETDLPLY